MAFTVQRRCQLDQRVSPPAPECSSVCPVLRGGPKGEGWLRNAGLPAGRETQHQFWSTARQDQSAPGQARAHQREVSDLHQHRFRDALQTSRVCWALREPTRKERARQQAGRGRGRARARGCARLPARSRWRRSEPGRARDGGGCRGSSRSLSPSSFPLSALLEGLCGRDPEAPGFLSAGWGWAGQSLLLEGKPKVRVFAPSRQAAAPGGPWAPGLPSLCSPASTR